MYISIGRITGTFGVSGEVKARVFSDDTRRFERVEKLYAAFGDSGDDRADKRRALAITGLRYHKDGVLLKFEGIDDMTGALSLKEAFLQVPESELAPLPPGRYYIYQLIGLSVWEKDICYGKIADVMQPGSNDVYVVRDGKREILIPVLKSVVKNVDIEAGRVEVELPPGLLELYI